MSQQAPAEVPPKLFEKTGIRTELLDEDACKVVARLRRKGHESFLVGGCVRDLLLRRTPKDFDVATSARPRQVKSLFRNCRIIGRRFKLAHLHFEQKILEVSTFRRRPEQDQNEDDEEDLLIRSDNAFGTASEDAHRRDFTINALFLDPESDSIHDYVGGIEDIERGLVRTIGDPLTRIKEDPVRILRAIKFAARLGLSIDDATWTAMLEAAPDLSRSAPPRLLEEVTRLLRSGSALRSFQLLRACGALEVLLPELHKWMVSTPGHKRLAFWRGLEALDSRVRRDADAVTTPVLFAVMLWPLFDDARDDDESTKDADLGQIVEDVLGPILKNLSFSRLESGRLKRILVVQRRFGADITKPEPTVSKRRGRSRAFRPSSFVKQDYFLEALQLFELRCMARDTDWDELDRWSELFAETTGEAPPVRRSPAAEPPAEREARRESHRDPSTRRSDSNGHVRKERPSNQEHGSNRERGSNTAQGRQSARGDERGRGHDRSRGEDRSRGKRGRKNRRGRDRGTRIEPESSKPLPPLPDVELDPTEIPTYGSVLGDTGSADKIELERSKGKRARKRMKENDEPYVPPPPPEDSGSRTDDEDVFGDW
ncbi:MAG: polynucleotide adenylyltransferase PcnB [Planctomycetes bacterium]|nr:polynucleotide adenylyltransferase PcnB [Planctomycetota bacterium]